MNAHEIYKSANSIRAAVLCHCLRSSESFLLSSLHEVLGQEGNVLLIVHRLLTLGVLLENTVRDLELGDLEAAVVAGEHETGEKLVAVQETVLVRVDLVPGRLRDLLSLLRMLILVLVHHPSSHVSSLHLASHSHSLVLVSLVAHALLLVSLIIAVVLHFFVYRRSCVLLGFKFSFKTKVPRKICGS